MGCTLSGQFCYFGLVFYKIRLFLRLHDLNADEDKYHCPHNSQGQRHWQVEDRPMQIYEIHSFSSLLSCLPGKQYPRAPEGFEENVWCGFASWGLAGFVFCLLAYFTDYNRLFGWKQLFKLRYKGFFKAAVILLKVVRQETCSNIMPSIIKAIVSVIAHFSNTFQFFLREVSLSPLLFYYSFLPPEIIPLLVEI